MFLAKVGSIASSKSKGGDADVAAFLSATGISDTTTVNAITTLVASLKSNSLWTSALALYPMVGGTSTTCSFNLKNPAQFQLTYTGAPSFAANGMTPSTGNYGDTGLNDSLLTFNDSCFGYYSRTSNTTDGADMGVSDSTNPLQELNCYNGGSPFIGFMASGSLVAAVGLNLTNGLFEAVSDNISGTVKLYRNGAIPAGSTAAVASVNTKVNLSFLVGYARASVGSGSKQCAWAHIYNASLVASRATLYTIIQTFQTSLSRQV